MFQPARLLRFCTLLFLFSLGGVGAAAADTYQVTGPILALTPSTITVEKNEERWEIARDPGAKGDSSLKIGDRVTIHYRMVATKVESNSSKSAGEGKPASKAEAAEGTKSKKNATR